MIVQVIENLLSNSVYWLRQRRLLDPDHKGKISITVDIEAREISVSDNGPGIPKENKDSVFEAFFTTKPAGQGKGLGLFIAREIARYHGADLRLEGPKSSDTLRKFVLNLENVD